VRPLYHRVLITGANGLIGQALVERFASVPEVDLLATSREDAPRYSGGSGGYVPLDVTDPEAVRRLFLDFAPSAVIHCAAFSKVGDCEADRDGCWETNVDGTGHLARACRAHGAHLVLLSTDFVFDGADGPYDERARPNPVNFYGRSKLAAENAVRTAGLTRWSVVRTTLGFGTGENLRRGNFGLFLVEQLSAGNETLVPTDQVRTPIYIPDLADGIARVVTLRKGGVYHLAGRELLSVWDFAQQLARQLELDASLLAPTTTAELHQRAPRPLHAGLIILKAETELGFKPRPLEQALAHFGRRVGLPVSAP
jgi:dTDP-4-dehydrorhamnose reductase